MTGSENVAGVANHNDRFEGSFAVPIVVYKLVQPEDVFRFFGNHDFVIAQFVHNCSAATDFVTKIPRVGIGEFQHDLKKGGTGS